ncbi:VWA domain-containing protein [Sporosarcina sp. FSL W7-1349]|uniref:VWA domain-containing protein n=1 Tax=Sporosarcina sp. FSL W7-1349 TaxID=2921561 RepID=UPI0030F8BA38
MKKLWMGIVTATLFLSGCSSDKTEEISAEEQAENVEETEQKAQLVEEYTPKKVNYFEIADPGRELSELEQELLREPGIFSGDAYDEVKVNEALDQFPDDLTPEQYVEELKYLFTEDYHDELETLLHFDPTVDVDLARPDESVAEFELKKVHFAILIDASGSMKAMSGNRTRMEAAKEAVLEFAEQIPEEATISMRVYGHKGSGSKVDKDLSCSSTENLYNGTFDKGEFQKSLQSVQPAGWTPIGLVLEKVKEDIPANVEDVIVYVVSDGIETCDGDPVNAAKKLASDNIETVVNIIGFDVDDEGQRLLKEVASAGNGEFTYVSSERDLKEFMRAQYQQIKQDWIDWKVEGQLETIKVKQDKVQLAIDTKQSMVEKAVREKQRMEAAQNYLKKRFSEAGHPISEVYSLVSKYGASKYHYAEEKGSQAYRESVESGAKKFKEFDEEGSRKIKELNEKN